MTAQSSYSQWLLSDTYPDPVEHRSVGSAKGSLLRLQLKEAVPDPATADVTIQLLIRGNMNTRADLGAGRFSGSMRTGTFAVTPEHVPLQIEGEGRAEFLVLAVRGIHLRALASETLGRDILDFGGLHSGIHRDDRLATLMGWLWRDAEEGFPEGRLFQDNGLQMIVSRLLALQTRRHAPQRGGLAPWQLRRVCDYLQEHLADDVSLTDLGALTGLTTAHLCRAFSQSTGLPPHRWRMARRIERAQELLRHTSMSVTDIAAAVGYDDPGHLSVAFRKALGISPTQYRRDRC